MASSRRVLAAAILVSAASADLPAQILLKRDFRPYQTITCNLVCDATITVPYKMAIPYYNNTNNKANVVNAANNFVSNLKTAVDYSPGLSDTNSIVFNGTTYLTGDSIEAWFIDTVFGDGASDYLIATAAEWQPYLIWAQVIISAAQMYAASENVIYRTYDFYAPTNGTFTFNANVKGGWDNPNNKVAIFSMDRNGAQVFAWHESFASDRTVKIPVNLPKGGYRILVGLGGGSSAQFHTAGTLGGIVMTNPSPATWTMPATLNSLYAHLGDSLPYVGATTVFQVPFTGYPNPALFLGGVPGGSIHFSNPRAEPAVLADPSQTARAMNKPIEFFMGTLMNYAPPTFDGTTARFSVRRSDDVEWIDDPTGEY